MICNYKSIRINLENSQTWKLKRTVLDDQCIKEEIKEEIKSILRQMKMERKHIKPFGFQQNNL